MKPKVVLIKHRCPKILISESQCRFYTCLAPKNRALFLRQKKIFEQEIFFFGEKSKMLKQNGNEGDIIIFIIVFNLHETAQNVTDFLKFSNSSIFFCGSIIFVFFIQWNHLSGSLHLYKYIQVLLLYILISIAYRIATVIYIGQLMIVTANLNKKVGKWENVVKKWK